MIVDRIMEHVKRQRPAIDSALNAMRVGISRQYQRPSWRSLRLTASEVSSAIDDVLVGDFFEAYPEYRDLDYLERQKIVDKLERLKTYIFMTQFAPRLQDVVQTFRFESRLIAEQHVADLGSIYHPLLRCLDRATTGAAALRENAPLMREHALHALAVLPEDFDPLVVRSLIEIVEYCDQVFPETEVSMLPHHAEGGFRRPANDNSVPAAAWNM
jgi:hypothetical protein